MLQRDFPGLPALYEVESAAAGCCELMAASFALGGPAACDPPARGGSSLPTSRCRPGIVPGVPRDSSPRLTRRRLRRGVVVTAPDGPPDQDRGQSPPSREPWCDGRFTQASILTSTIPTGREAPLPRAAASVAAVRHGASTALRAELVAPGAEGLRILTGAATSPTLGGPDRRRCARRFPRQCLAPVGAEALDDVAAGATLAFGRAVDTRPRPDPGRRRSWRSRAISSARLPGHLRYARRSRRCAARRRREATAT